MSQSDQLTALREWATELQKCYSKPREWPASMAEMVLGLLDVAQEEADVNSDCECIECRPRSARLAKLASEVLK
mgnify:CR=1 FL=1